MNAVKIVTAGEFLCTGTKIVAHYKKTIIGFYQSYQYKVLKLGATELFIFKTLIHIIVLFDLFFIRIRLN